MKTESAAASSTTKYPFTRRSFLKTGAILTAASMTVPYRTTRAQANKNSKLRIFQIGAGNSGSIGSMQRDGLKGHPMVEWAGFCDVDEASLNAVADKYPGSFKLVDYREAFANRVDQFDAVIVDVPDFHHAPAMLNALKYNKHSYGQKPLVHQLDELRMIRAGLKARPNLVTQMGNQRSCNKGRMQAVEILKKNQLGRPVEAYVWTGDVARGHYFADPWQKFAEAKPVPPTLHWDLWNGPLTTELPYSEDLTPRRWRTFWQTGGGQFADWGCHLIDVLYFAYDLPNPEAVMTHTPKPPSDSHTAHNLSTITYPGGGGKFAREKFVLHYNDSGLMPSFTSLGLPLPSGRLGANQTLVVCEEGTLLLDADARNLRIYRKGKEVENEPLPETTPHNHWKDWADNCLGDKKHLWTPWEIGSRITEPALLAVKATKYPGKELLWDAASYKFTNYDKANQEILSREYRKGFEPPEVV